VTDGWTVDHTTASFQAWIDAHPPTRELADWEQAELDRAFDVPDWMQIRAEIRRNGEDY
jgi:hypothetical protein